MISTAFVISPGRKEAPSSRGELRSTSLLREFHGDQSNALVRSAAKSFGQQPPPFNPLVLIGPTQIGKTHLAHLLAARWSQQHAGSNLIWLTGQDYLRSYAHAVETDSVNDLRRRWRRADCWVLDGLDIVATRVAAQVELVGTLDALLARDAAILVTSRLAPFELPDLMPNLSGRLTGGLTIPMGPPGPAARLAVLEQLAQQQKRPLPAEAAHLLAKRLDHQSQSWTVPQLDQLLRDLSHALHTQPGESPAKLIDQLLDDQPTSPEISLRSISSAVAQYFGIKPTDLKGPSRRQWIVRARGVAIFLGRQLAGESLDRLGHHFGGRDHTTALHACRKTEELLAVDPALQEAVEQLTKRLRDEGGKDV